MNLLVLCRVRHLQHLLSPVIQISRTKDDSNVTLAPHLLYNNGRDMAIHRQTPFAIRIHCSNRSRRDRHYIFWRVEGHIRDEATDAKRPIQSNTTHERS